MPHVYRQPAARSDLIEHFVYLAEEAGEVVADRFMDAVDSSFNLLGTQPKIGALLTLRSTELAGIRKWSVSGFDRFLIFYLPRPNGVTIVRVLHASTDWWGLLGLA